MFGSALCLRVRETAEVHKLINYRNLLALNCTFTMVPKARTRKAKLVWISMKQEMIAWSSVWNEAQMIGVWSG